MSIKTVDLTHIYNKDGPYEKVAIENINIEIKQGEFVGIIGHTGSGKSTLIQHLNGIIKPTCGTVYVDDVDVFAKGTDMKGIRAKVGMVFQYPEHQLFEENVYKDIVFGLKNYGVDPSEFEERALEAVQTVGLSEDVFSKSPFELSGGQKRRVAIAGVIAMRPEVLILDEPAAGLDPYGRKLILDEIRALHDKTGTTVILVSHSMEDIAYYADRIIVMHKGAVAMDGTPCEVFSNADELEKMSLDVPQVTSVLNGIRKMGYNVRSGIFNASDAADEIYKILTANGDKNVK